MTFLIILLFIICLLLFGPLGPSAGTWIIYFILTFCYLWNRENGNKKLFWIFFILAQMSIIAWAIYECVTY